MEYLKEHRWKLAAALAFAAYFLVFWKKVYLSGLLPADANTLLMSFPDWAVGKKLAAGGTLPLWNPFRDLGEPFLADPKTAVLYPATWLTWLSGYSSYFRTWVLVHAAVSFVFAFLLVENLNKDRTSAAAAGVLAAFNGMMVAKISIPIYVSSLSWMYAAAYFLAAGRTVPLALALALQWFAGYPPFSLLTLAGLAAMLPLLEAPAESARRLAAAFALFLGLAAAQLLPFLEMLKESARGPVVDPASALVYSIPPSELLKKLFVPLWSAFSPESAGDPAVTGFYFGFAPLAGAAALLLGKGGGRRYYPAAFFAAAMLLCLGEHLPGYASVPFLRVFRYPANWLAPGALAAVLLTGAGLSRLGGTRLRAALACAAALELLANAQLGHKLWVRPEFFTEPPGVLGGCRPGTRLFHSPLLREKLEAGFSLGTAGDLLLTREAAYPSYPTAFGFGEVGSYQVLASRRVREFAARAGAAGPGSDLLEKADVGAVITLKAGPSGNIFPAPVAVAGGRPARRCYLWPGAGRVDVLEDRPGLLRASAETAAPAAFVFTEAWYPGWRLKVDGRYVRPGMFEGVFLSCPLPPGRHTLEFRYRPMSFIAGSLITALTLAALLFSAAVRRRRRTGG